MRIPFFKSGSKSSRGGRHNHSHNSSKSQHRGGGSNHQQFNLSSKWTRILILTFLQMVTVLSQAMKDQPKFSEGIPNITVAVGRDASLPCIVENLGQHKIAFVHIDRRMILTIHRHIVTKIPRFSVSYDSHKTWLLHINSVQQEDRGYYMCQVNTSPMISQVGYLQVVVPPNILDEESSESHVAVREHQNITLSCKAEGFPEPRITWKREDGQPFAIDRRKKVNVSEGESLKLHKVSRLEMGAYLCIASNSIPPSVSKRIELLTEFYPTIFVQNQLIGAAKGMNVTLECVTEAFPRAISYWVYDNLMILTTGKYNTEIVETSYRTHMRLTVRNLKEKDFGRYKGGFTLSNKEHCIVLLYEIPVPSTPPRATEIKQEKNNQVGGVRLNPISKTENEKWNKGRDRESKSSNRVPSDFSSPDAPSGFNRTSIRVPNMGSINSGTDSAGRILQLSFAKCTISFASLYLTVLVLHSIIIFNNVLLGWDISSLFL